MSRGRVVPGRPPLPPRARLGADRRRRGGDGHHLAARRTRSASSSTTSRRTSASTVAKDSSYGEVESVKAVSDLISPLSGEVLEVNQLVVDAPETVNEDPYGDGWLVRIRLANPSERGRSCCRSPTTRRSSTSSELPLAHRRRPRRDARDDRRRDASSELFRDIPPGVRFDARPRRPAGPDGGRSCSGTSRSSPRGTSSTRSASSAPASTTITCRRSSTRCCSAASC